MKKWTNLTFFLAVAHTGGVAAAARKLNVNHATVLRRIADLEAELGILLFNRLPTGYQLTAAGKAVLKQAKRIEDEALAIETTARAFKNEARQIDLRMTIPNDGLNVAPILLEYAKEHSNVHIAVAKSSRFFNLESLESDVALRLTNNPPQNLIGQKLGEVRFVPFVSQSLFKPDTKPDQYPWIFWSYDIADNQLDKLFDSLFPKAQCQFRTDSLDIAISAVQSGLGACVLPLHAFGDDAEAQMLDVLELSYDIEVWLLTHKDFRYVSHIKELFELFRANFNSLLAI